DLLRPDLRGTVRVVGGPGTGKTTRLIDAAVAHIGAGADPGCKTPTSSLAAPLMTITIGVAETECTTSEALVQRRRRHHQRRRRPAALPIPSGESQRRCRASHR
ncbi:MAG: hypothetical protein O3B27_11170, partial [Actinomycetota bacterium]|nr:hypothetical protein [Actinomycetota bacterium]